MCPNICRFLPAWIDLKLTCSKQWCLHWLKAILHKLWRHLWTDFAWSQNLRAYLVLLLFFNVLSSQVARILFKLGVNCPNDKSLDEIGQEVQRRKKERGSVGGKRRRGNEPWRQKLQFKTNFLFLSLPLLQAALSSHAVERQRGEQHKGDG